MKVMLDLDEVLADFCGGVYEAFGVDRRDVERVWNLGKWDIRYPLTDLIRHRPIESHIVNGVMTNEYFWSVVNAVPDFWVKLHPLPWMFELLKGLAKRVGEKNIFILSSPSRETHCYDQKTRWLRGYLGEDFDRFFITPHKEMLAGPDRVLIDDCDWNIFGDPKEGKVGFIEAGGHGIVFPRLHNSEHQYKGGPVGRVLARLEDILG